MNNSYAKVHPFVNEKVLTYEENSLEYQELIREYDRMKSERISIPLVIGGREIHTEKKGVCVIPHDKNHVLAEFSMAGAKEAEEAIEAALEAKVKWDKIPWDERASIFMRAAALASGSYRSKLNAATMLGQSKTYRQTEIDAAAELCDFFRSNARLLHDIYANQPLSPDTHWNRVDYRPLEGFIFAVSPFNFTSIAANLAGAPAIAGNTVVWKPSSTAVYSNWIVYQLFNEAGLPDGVINFIPASSGDISDVIFQNKHLAGVHFTGSTATFNQMFRTVGENIDLYRTYPRLVGETGGKNFVVAHESANLKLLARGLRDGAFEFQGQKCSAASRAYIPVKVWPQLKEILIEDMKTVKMGDVRERDTFLGAVIDTASFNRIKGYIEAAKESDQAEIIYGGNCDDHVGYFVEPTIILTTDPHFLTMEEEIFGPVLTVYLYDQDYDELLELVDNTSQYGLTGSIFAEDRYAIVRAQEVLVNAAGNFYVNVRPTGAVVGQQPFGGARKSGTNDKAGALNNMLRWLSPRAIKEEYLK
ncbi:MAG: L-glutamate gamma-semialdehyde dehydrogenase [Tissierellia bacterium]|nr:L-glutamate gamma-semialdehyde dehydrogenase [Tissierellia bacterium]